MFGGPEINAGDGSKNVIGDANDLRTIVLNAPQPAIHRNYLYDVSKKIIEADIKSSDDYSLESNAAWSRKLDHNNVSVQYREILTGEAYAYDVIEEIMSTFTNRDVLVKKVRHVYLVHEKTRVEQQGDGDSVLQAVFNDLEKALVEHENSLTERMPDEERHRCIWLVMFYVFTKCQLLNKPDVEVV